MTITLEEKRALKHAIVGIIADKRQQIEPKSYKTARWLEVFEVLAVDTPAVRMTPRRAYQALEGERWDTLRFTLGTDGTGSQWWTALDRKVELPTKSAAAFDGSWLYFDGLTILAASKDTVIAIKRWGDAYHVYSYIRAK